MKRLESSSTSQEILMHNIHKSTLQVYGQTPQDGNCFFHAICLQLKRLDNMFTLSAQQIREDVVDLILNTDEIKVTIIFYDSLYIYIYI